MKDEEALPLLEYWYSALRERFGVKFQTSDPNRLRAKLYLARKTDPNPELQRLSIITSPANPDGELWIAFRDIELDPKDE